MASELEFDLRHTVDWGSKWLFDFNAEKSRLVLFGRCNNSGAIDVKMDGSVLEEKSSLKMLELTFSSNLGWGTYIISIATSAPKKTGALICSMKFLSPFSINQPYSHAWNTVVMSGLVLLVAMWKCWKSYKSRYGELLVLHLLPFLNP